MRPFWIYLVLALGAALLLHAVSAGEDRISYARFRELVDSKEIAELEIKGDLYVGRTAPDPATRVLRSFRTGRIESNEKDLLAALDQRAIPYTRTDATVLPGTMWWLLPLAGVLGLLHVALRKAPSAPPSSPVLSFGKNKARLYADLTAPTTFRDVAGSVEAKTELAEVVEFLRSPERYRRLGGRMPKGVLLERARPCSPGPWRARPASRSSARAARSSSRCSSASAPPACATCSRRRARRARASSSSTSSTPSASRAG